MEALKAEALKIEEEFEEICNQAVDHAMNLMAEDCDIELEAEDLINRKMRIEEEMEFLAQKREAINLALVENRKRSQNLAGEKEEMDQMKDEKLTKLRRRKAEVKQILDHIRSGELSKQAGSVGRIWQRCIEKKEEDLTCPVCLEVAKTPIYTCPDSHIICSACATIPELKKCPECREDLPTPLKRHRFAEKIAEELEELLQATDELAGSRSTFQSNSKT